MTPRLRCSRDLALKLGAERYRLTQSHIVIHCPDNSVLFWRIDPELRQGGQVRLPGKTIGTPLPSQNRAQEDMRPIFDHLWRRR